MMSKPSYQAWIACNAVWNKLKPSEQALVKGFHAIRSMPDNAVFYFEYQVEQLAEQNNVSADYVWQTVKKAWQLWAIERGLADE